MAKSKKSKADDEQDESAQQPQQSGGLFGFLGAVFGGAVKGAGVGAALGGTTLLLPQGMKPYVGAINGKEGVDNLAAMGQDSHGAPTAVPALATGGVVGAGAGAVTEAINYLMGGTQPVSMGTMTVTGFAILVGSVALGAVKHGVTSDTKPAETASVPTVPKTPNTAQISANA